MDTKGASGLGTALSLVVLVSIAGFLFWISRQVAALPEPVVAEEIEEVPFTLDDLRLDPGAALGELVEFDTAAVAVGLGVGAFSLALDDSTAYPVLISSDQIQRFQARSTQVYGGDRVFLVGRVYSFNDSIRAAWVELGAVEESMAAEIPTTISFILADSVEIH